MFKVSIARNLLFFCCFAIYANRAIRDNGSDVISRGRVLQVHERLVKGNLFNISLNFIIPWHISANADRVPNVVGDQHREGLSSPTRASYGAGIEYLLSLIHISEPTRLRR